MPSGYKREVPSLSATLVPVYRNCTRPILEYACEVWHHSLPKYLSDQIESVQRRASNIIFPDTSYELARDKANLTTLSEHRSFLCNRLFCRMSQSSHKLNCLFLQYKSTKYNLRKQNTLFLPKYRTSRYGHSFRLSAIRRILTIRFSFIVAMVDPYSFKYIVIFFSLL